MYAIRYVVTFLLGNILPCAPLDPANVSEFIIDPYCPNLTLAESPLAAQMTMPISLFLMAGTAISCKHRAGLPAANLAAAEFKYKDLL
jgi:hypothetical protein